MYLDNAEGMVFRPPNEADSLILRVTIGCSHNACTFCGMYRGVKFRHRPMTEISQLIEQAAHYWPSHRRVFLADGNALALPTEQLLDIIAKLKNSFPKLSRITCYGGPKDILTKNASELTALNAAGLHTIYLGIESGDDEVLSAVNKGVTSAEMITAGCKVLDSGIKLSAMIILGLGGKTHTEQHASNTAAVVNATNPTMLSALTLMLHEGTPLRKATDSGKFLPLSPYELLIELRKIVEYTDLKHPCIFRSNHISNLLPLAGTLPKDKTALLADIDKALGVFKTKHDPLYNDRKTF